MKYRVIVSVQAYRVYEVEAENEDDACDRAYAVYNVDDGWQDWTFSEANLEVE